jgi:predicted dehydrogenase
MSDYRWGIAGPGGIAERFASAIALVEGGHITRVASRSPERARAYSDEHAPGAAPGTYEELAEDPDIDIVYVATPQTRHAADTIAYLEAGKHVLCEKPFALNASEAAAMVAAAQANERFLMEAIWSRYLPAYRELVGLVGNGAIGDLVRVEADFGFRMAVSPAHRLFDAALGGGALLDLGIYPIQLCSLLLGTPDQIEAVGTIGSTGVDEQVAALLHHPDGSIGIVSASIRANTSCAGRVTGTEGWIDLPPFMHCPEHLVLNRGAGPEHINAKFEGDGLRFEIDEVHRCLEHGRSESEGMPLDESVRIASTLDAIRDSIGLVYPGEPSPDRAERGYR